MFGVLQHQSASFDGCEELAAHVTASASCLQRVAGNLPSTVTELESIHREQREATVVMHRMARDLAHEYLGPIDPVDIQALIANLIDIVHAVDSVSKRIEDYHIDTAGPEFSGHILLLVQATQAVRQAVHRLHTGHSLTELSRFIAEIHRLQDAAAANHDAAMSRLFDGTFDAMHVMKWKELHDLVERAIDGCGDVGNTLERIGLKG